MNTPSHLVITAALRRRFSRIVIPRNAVLIGSIMPDLPLILLSAGGYGFFHLYRGWDVERTFRHMYDDLYFHDRSWIAAHNLFHSQILLLMIMAASWHHARSLYSRSEGTQQSEEALDGASGGMRRAGWIFWFAASCWLHSVIDILTHHDDGPLLFFPLEWKTRFFSPVSYWDSRYYGRQFGIFDLILNLVLLCYLFGPVWIRWAGLLKRGREP